MKHRKKIAIIFWTLFLIIAGFIIFSGIKHSSPSGKGSGGGGTPAKVVPLTDEQRQKVEETILSSDFVKDIPSKNPISIRFYYFENGSRVWQDKFYMAEGKLISGGKTGIDLTLHSKYIDDLNGNNLCDVIQDSNANRDLGFSSPYGNVKLAIKYSKLMKYRDCFGF